MQHKTRHNETIIAVGAAAAILLAALPLRAATRDWDGGAGTTDWFTPANWSDDTLPTASDLARINTACSESSPVVVAGAIATNSQIELGTKAGDAGYLHVRSGGVHNTEEQNYNHVGRAGRGHVRMSGGQFVVARHLALGTEAGASGTWLHEGGALTNKWGIHIGIAGTGVVVQTGGTIYCGGYNNGYLGSKGGHGTLIVSNGQFQLGVGNYEFHVGNGLLAVRGGDVSIGRDVYVADGSNTVAELEIDSGTFSAGWGLTVGNFGNGRAVIRQPFHAGQGLFVGRRAGSVGEVILDAVSVTFGTGYPLVVGGAGAGRVFCRGTTFTSDGVSGDLRVRESAEGFGLLRGWGKHDANDQLINNGLIIADGEGEERDLDLTKLDGGHGGPTWANPVENDGTNGWYAVAGGRLMLAAKSVAVTNLPSSHNWGEDRDDAEIDLVNSLRLTFASIPGVNSSFRFYLLAPDRADVPAPPRRRCLIGVWDGYFNGASFGTLDIELRYDHVAAGSQTPEVYRYDASAQEWELLPSTALPGYRLLCRDLPAAGSAKIGLFAVAVPPLPTTTVMILR